MDDPPHALEIFREHFNRSGITRGFTMLELGPGDSLASAVIARAMGATSSYLVDAGPFASGALGGYRALGSFLRGQSFDVPDFSAMEDVSSYANVKYLTDGLPSLRSVPSSSVDFCFSHAVLEHLPKNDFLPILCEMRRIQKPDGISSHSVDLKDHLGGSLNNLRFTERRWEGPLFSKSGFYTNRIRFSQMMELFQRAGFAVELLAAQRWQSLPIERKYLDRSFQTLSDDELSVKDFDVLLR
jgi:SAM-dependent methyltransferase